MIMILLSKTLGERRWTQADFLQGPLEVFGPQEYIETPEPEQMDREQHSAWLKWRWDHC